MRLVSVAVPVPFLGALTYAVPEGVSVPAIGARVLVPLGTRVMTGCVLDVVSPDGDLATIKEVIDVLDDEAFLPDDVIALATWVAEYYACGIGEAIAAAMPPRAWIESERYVQITDAGRAAHDDAAWAAPYGARPCRGGIAGPGRLDRGVGARRARRGGHARA